MALHFAAQVLNDQEVTMSGPVGRIPWVRSALTGSGLGWMAGEHVGGNKAGGHPAGARIVLWYWKQRNEGERWETAEVKMICIINFINILRGYAIQLHCDTLECLYIGLIWVMADDLRWLHVWVWISQVSQVSPSQPLLRHWLHE